MDINELRAEVIRRQKAANAKVARLRRRGVNVAGTDYDIRRESANVGRYNSRQLQSYLSQLNEFTSRRTSFVPGAEGAPIPRRTWNAYQRVQRNYNDVAKRHYENVKGIFIPNAGMTVAEFDSGVKSNRPGAKGGGPARPLNPVVRESFEVMGEKRLKELTRQLERKTQRGYLPNEIKKQRFQMVQAVREFGDPELVDMAKKLDDDQLDVLWNYTDAPRDMFSGYHFLKLLAAGKADEAQANIHEDAAYETRQWLEWASNLPSKQKPNRKNRR